MLICRLSSVALMTALLLVVAACGGGTGTPVPTGVTSPEAAVDAVRAVAPLFDGIGPQRDGAVGQVASWTARQEAQGWTVVITAGWGDCDSGCIDRHEWTWRVASDGTVAFLAEQGAPLMDAMLAELHATAESQGVGGTVMAGPVCPVEQPGDPACAPRNVSGATLVVQDASGKEIARFTTDRSGLFRIALEPGAYTLVPSSVEGYMGEAPVMPFNVVAGAEIWATVMYDTGIR